jgi:hypothetical protein
LSKKLTLRRPVPDISAAKSFHDLESEFHAFSIAARKGALPCAGVPEIALGRGTKMHQMSKWYIHSGALT